jgi:hypothetical protein
VGSAGPAAAGGQAVTVLFDRNSCFFIGWLARRGDVRPFFAGGHALGAAFNQLVRIIYFKSVLRWEPAFAFWFSTRTRVLRYLYLPQSALPRVKSWKKTTHMHATSRTQCTQ